MREDILTTDTLEQGRVKINSNFTELYDYHIGDYGGIGDGQTALDASITSGTDDLTTVADVFVPGDVGKGIRVYGAGAAGADLLTTILAYVSPSAVTLAANASTTIASKKIKWGTDNTTPFQNALQAIVDSDNSGTLYVPNGRYFVFGPLITSLDAVNPNCQIYIPKMEKPNNTGLLTIKILGESAPAVFGTILTNTAAVLETGVIIESMIVGSGTIPRVFGSSFYNTGFVDTNSVQLQFENIRIRVKSMTGTAHVAPTMTAFGLKYIEAVDCLNCLADTESISFDSVEPASANVIGFEYPNQASQERIRIINCMAKNYYKGFNFNEHVVADGLRADSCYYGFTFGGNGAGHPSLGIRLYTNGCKYGLVIDDSPNIQILQYASEVYPGSIGFDAKWYNGTADFLSINTGTPKGIVTYDITGSGGSIPTPVFSGTFTWIKFINIHAIAKYTGSSGTFPNIDYPYEQIRYIGSAVSTDTFVPDLQFVHKQNGTAHNIGRLLFINEQSGDADERLVQIAARTNGAIDKGLLRMAINSGTAIVTVSDLSTDKSEFFTPVKVPSYTVAGLPSAATAGAGAMAYASNAAGGGIIVFSDATNWRRVDDRTVVSA